MGSRETKYLKLSPALLQKVRVYAEEERQAGWDRVSDDLHRAADYLEAYQNLVPEYEKLQAKND
jgi:hypothetical protein